MGRSPAREPLPAASDAAAPTGPPASRQGSLIDAELRCHSKTPCAALGALRVRARRTAGGHLHVGFRLEGAIERVLVPQPQAPRFTDGLWRHTCCEIFVRRQRSDAYEEFNLSPAGQWAAYAFERYREGRPLDIADPRIQVRARPSALELEATLPIPGEALSLAACAVVESSDGALSYWSVRHAAGPPDFHHPDAFALELL